MNMYSGVLEMKLHEVHFADKFSGAELAEAGENLSAKCTECSFNPNVNEEVSKYPMRNLQGEGYLAYL